MLQILSTDEAIQDLDDIWDYIAKDNLTAADNLIDQIQRRFSMLAEFPLMGEIQPLLADGTYRRFVDGNYVIYYRPQKDAILIVRILHGSRDEKRQF